MNYDLNDHVTIHKLVKDIFPYYIINSGFFRMITNLLTTKKENFDAMNKICHQFAKDYNTNKDKNGKVTHEGWNTIFQEKLVLNCDGVSRDTPEKWGDCVNKSLLLHRYWEYDFQSTFNIIFLIASGGYHIAIREMRYILEAFVHAFCIDKMYNEFSLSEKFTELKKIEDNKDKRFWRKSNLFTHTFQEHAKVADLGIDLYNFWKILGGKVHPSYEELSHLRKSIKKTGEKHTMIGLYSLHDEESLGESLDFLSKLHKYIITILDSY